MVEPTQIAEKSDSQILITWSDGEEFSYDALSLRRACPCATCVNEWTGEKILKDEKISDDLTINSTSLVGRYALNFKFSDGHDTGIYSFKLLREMKQ